MKTLLVVLLLLVFVTIIPPIVSADDERDILLKEALRAVETIESATKTGLLYRDYLNRLAEAQAALDRAERAHPNASMFQQIQIAMGYYRRATSWWQEKIRRSTLLVKAARQEAEKESCQSLRKLLLRTPEEWDRWRDEQTTAEERRRDAEFRALQKNLPGQRQWEEAKRIDQANSFTVALSVSALWECASQALVQARQSIP